MVIKRNTVLGFLLSAVLSLSMYEEAHCQDSIPRSGKPDKYQFINPQKTSAVIKINPFLIIWGSIALTAEYRLVIEFTTSAHQSTQIGVSYIDKSPILRIFEDSTGFAEQLLIKGGRFEISHRFYLNRKGKYAPSGFFISPHISYASARFSTKQFNQFDYYLRITQFNISALAGWQWLLGDKFAINVFTGWGYKNNFMEMHDPQGTVRVNTDDLGPIFNSPLKFTLGMYVGWAF